MRRTSVLCIAILVSCCAVGCSRRRPHDVRPTTTAVMRQAEPVRNWLQAIKARDVELLKTVFADRWLSHFERQGWGTMLGVYTTLWTDKLGEFDVDELTFRFTPLPEEAGLTGGYVIVERGGVAFPRCRIVYEDGCWKVDEL